jgi:hypothetical protein
LGLGTFSFFFSALDVFVEIFGNIEADIVDIDVIALNFPMGFERLRRRWDRGRRGLGYDSFLRRGDVFFIWFGSWSAAAEHQHTEGEKRRE